MTKVESEKGYTERLEDLISMANAGKPCQIGVNLRKEIVKQLIFPEETDNLKVERDLYLLMADFTPAGGGAEGRKSTKVYAFGAINETDVEEKVVRSIANERLKMDYRRFRDAKVQCEEKFF